MVWAVYLQTSFENQQTCRIIKGGLLCAFPRFDLFLFSRDVVLLVQELTCTSDGCCELPWEKMKCVRTVLLVLTAEYWRLGIWDFWGVSVMWVGLSLLGVDNRELAEVYLLKMENATRMEKGKRDKHWLNDDPGQIQD